LRFPETGTGVVSFENRDVLSATGRESALIVARDADISLGRNNADVMSAGSAIFNDGQR